MSWIFAPGTLFSGRSFRLWPDRTVLRVGLAFVAGAAVAGVASKLPTKAEQEERAAAQQQARTAGSKSSSRPIRVIPITRDAEKAGAKDSNTGAVGNAAAMNSATGSTPRLPANISAPPARPEVASAQPDVKPPTEDRSAASEAASDATREQPEVQSTKKRRTVKSRAKKRNRAYARDDWPVRRYYGVDHGTERSAWRAYDDDRPRYRSFWDDDRPRYRSRRANRYDERGPPRFFLFD